MIAPVDITNVRSPASVDTSALASTVSNNVAQEALSNLTQNAVGQLFQTQVLSQLEDGTYLVGVAGNALRMALPTGTPVGSTLEMTLLATDPRPAFLLEQQNDGTSASLSSAAKLINTVLQTAQQAGAPATLTGKAPLVASSPTSAPELAVALKDSVEFSGIFYESHVSQWVSGERSLSDLMREPQVQSQQQPPAQTGTEGKILTANATTVLQRPAVTEAELSKFMTNIRNAADTQPSLAQALGSLAKGNMLPDEADTVLKSPTLTPENAQTINLQLNALEQHRIAWQGELWPGQSMEWEIREEMNDRKRQDGADENQAVWQSVVRFELPNLGKISASVYLSGDRVRMQINTASAASAAALKVHGDDLANALEAAGSPLDSLTIKQDGQT